MIEIKDISGKTLMTVPVSSGAINHEELMKSDYIQLDWNSPVGDILPAGAFIEYDGEKYSLLEPYQPACTSEAEYQYTPQFQSRIMVWDKHPVPLYTYDDEGNVVSREFDWEFTGSPADVLYMVKQAIMHEVGEEWTYQLSDSLPATVSLQSQSSSIFSILSELAEDCETEWWVDKKNNLLHLSKCEHGERVMLTAGQNVKMPSITNSKDGYYTRFYVFGSTKNITQDYQSGQATNHIVNKRLTLDPVKYPGGYKDIKGHFDNGVFVSDLLPGEIFPKSLYFDSVFPSSKLTITNVRARAKYRLDSNGNKIQIGGTEDEPVYEQYAIWYFRVEGLDFDPQTIIEGKNLSVSFESGQLEGRDFELTYHEKDQTVKDAADVTAFEVKAGDFEIIIDESTGIIIPGAVYIIPQDGDKIVLYNIEMPDEYTASAQVELEAEIDKEIARRIADNNTYEFDSNPVDFYNHGTDVELGQAVRFSFGGGTLETRVLMVEKRLDGIYQQRIRIGNEQIKGVTQELKEDVANANQNIDIIKAFNELSSSLSNAYANAQREMIEGFAAIRNMWRFDPENPNTIYSSYNVYSLGEVAAGGPGSSSGGGTGGLDENQLWAILANTGTEQISKTHLTDALSGYATENWVLAKNYLTSAALSGYATQSWVTAQGYITSAALEGYATIADVDNRIDDLINGAPAAYDTLKEIADVLQGNVDSIGDIITTLGTKADKAISISAGTGLTGGGNLSASRTLSLATVCTAGTYTKVIVDAYGRVTGHSALAESDIPTLSIAKISGLQTALDNKLDESVFTDLFEKVQVDGNTFIKAKYNLFSIGEVAAGGAGTGSGSSGGIDEAQLWSILGNNGTEQIAKNHLTTALSGYATETWVTGKGYATQSWVTSKGYITSAALEGYATESWVTGKNYLTAITKAMVEAVLTGNITTHTHSQYLTAHQAIYALTIKAGSTTAVTFSPKTAAATLTLEAGSGISLSADATAKKITIANTYKYTLPTASASVLGGVKIGANITITNGVISTHAPYSHPTATANTIAAATGKVLSAITVNSLGHVTSVAAKTLAAGDIPTLSISKISGLQTSLDSKLNASVFNELFEKVTQDGQTFIKAKYNLYSVGEVAAGGPGSGSGGTGSGIDEEQLWAILSNTGTEQIAKNHLTTALTGYATQSWVTSQNYLKTVSLATISDLHANWDALLKVAPSAYITRWPSISEVTSKQNLVVKLNSGTTEGTNMFTYNVTAAKTVNITPSAIGAAASSHNHSWANITSGKPTTLAGYGITDGVNAVSVTGSGNAITAASVSGHTLTLTKGSTFLLSSAYTAADILAKLKTVDGSGSGLDADTLDGIDANDLFTNLSNSGNNISITIGGTNKTLTPAYATNTGGALSGNIQFKSAMKNDNGGRDTYLLIADCSVLFSQDTGSHFGFNGIVFCHRNAGYPINEVVNVSATVGYMKTNYQLYTSYYSRIQPCIVLYNSKYYVALQLKGSSFNLYMQGKWQNVLSSFIQLNVDTGNTYPTGMSIVVNGVSYYPGVFNAATRLLTSRTIWGKSFDGTENISGNMTGVGTITFTGNPYLFFEGGDNYIIGNSGNNTLVNANEGLLVLGYRGTTYIDFYAGATGSNVGTIVGRWSTTGLGIGTTNISHKLQVAGTMYASGAATLGSTLSVTGLITATAGLTTPQYIQIGSGRIYWDATNNALYVKKSDGTACNFYSLGEIAAGGAGTGSGGTGGGIDEEQLWAILGNTGTEQIAKNHLTSALAGYLTSVSLSTIKDLHANWDAVLKVAPTSYVTRWPSFAEVTAKPTTLSGYGITDAVTIETTQTITGSKTFSRDAASVVYVKNRAASNTSQYVAVRFTHGSSDVGGIAGDKDGSALYRVNSGFTTVYKLLDTGNYTSTLDTRYVKKAGDTMNGALTINSGILPLIINSNDATQVSTHLKANGTDKVSLGWTSENGTYLYDYPSGSRIKIYNDAPYYNTYKIWHLGNDGSGSGLDADLLDGTHKTGLLTALSSSSTTNISLTVGGTTKTISDLYATTAEKLSTTSAGSATRPVYFANGIPVAGTYTFGNASGNAAISNGTVCTNLNSDLLDGLHYSSFESYKVVSIDASSLDNDTWYPVTMLIGNSLQTRIRIEGNTSADATWNPRSDKAMALILDYTVNGSQWGWTSVARVIYQYTEGLGTSSCLRGLGQLTNSSTEYVFVRGGAKYNFYVSRFITPVLRTSTYTISSQSVSPTTTAPSSITINNALITSNVASATKLQTPRTIWGQSFDGTANVSGSLSTVGSITGAGDLALIGKGQITLRYSDAENNSVILTANSFRPILGSHNNIDLGASTARWRNLYSVLGNFSGAVTMSSSLKVDGITVLSSLLKLYNSDNTYRLTQSIDGTASLARIYMINEAGSAYGDLSLGHSSSNAIYIKGGNNVGIGTASPSYKLHVAGTVGITGLLTVGAGISSTTGTFNSLVSVNRIKITDTDAIEHIEFSRAGYNYIVTPASGVIAFDVTGSSSHSSASDLVIQSGSIHSGTTNATACGTSSARWSNVYSVLGNFSGAVTLFSTLSVSSTSTFTGKTTHNGGIACANEMTLSSDFRLNGSAAQKIYKYYSETNWSQLQFLQSKASNGGFTDILLNIQSSNTIQFECGGNFIWFSQGNIAAKGEVAAGSTSDARLKNVLTTPDYQKRLLALGDVVDYEYNNKAFQRNTRTIEHRRYTGLIYQNVVSVLPQMAGKDDDGYGYLNYIHTDYINLIAGALQQTIRKQETIEQRVERLERENEELKQQLKRLAA